MVEVPYRRRRVATQGYKGRVTHTPSQVRWSMQTLQGQGVGNGAVWRESRTRNHQAGTTHRSRTKTFDVPRTWIILTLITKGFQNDVLLWHPAKQFIKNKSNYPWPKTFLPLNILRCAIGHKQHGWQLGKWWRIVDPSNSTGRHFKARLEPRIERKMTWIHRHSWLQLSQTILISIITHFLSSGKLCETNSSL